MSPTLPAAPNPFPRWVLLAALALLLGLGVYCVWTRPREQVDTEGSPVIMTSRTQAQVQALVGGDLARAAQQHRASAVQDSLARLEAFRARQAKAAALHLHHQSTHVVPAPLAAASAADSVRELTRYFATF